MRQHRRCVDLAVVLGTGQQFANKSVQFFAGRQGRRCFISGSQLLRQHRRCVDLAIVLGTGQQFTDKSVQFFTGGQSGCGSHGVGRRQISSRRLAHWRGLQWRRSRCRTARTRRLALAEDARKGRFFSRQQGLHVHAGRIGRRAGGQAFSRGEFCEFNIHIQRDRLRTGGRRGRSRHDRRCASGDGAKSRCAMILNCACLR